MKTDNGHIDISSNPAMDPGDFFQYVAIPFEKTREEAWAEVEPKLTRKVKPLTSQLKTRSYRLIYATAAVFLLVAGIFSVMRFYTTTVSCPAGQHLTYNLPDGSTLEMNADSRMAFNPFWWQFARKLNFEGEGYFEVEKGKKFEILSDVGTTEVLGTSFNIYARDREYKVTCFTGKVKVTSFSSDEAMLSPEYNARIDSDGNIEVQKDEDAGLSKAWINNMFNFTAMPLIRVLNEIARQYNVTIRFRTDLDYSYTGYFSKDKPLEDVLELVCKPFGLTFARTSENEYEISQN